MISIDIEDFRLFSAGSANDHENAHLWLQGASQFLPQLNRLLSHTEYEFLILDIESFNGNSNELGRVLRENGSDKSTSHNYHIVYSHILDKLGRQSPLNILEIGLGTNNPHLVSSMGMGARPGASLYAFREYLPNARIYGCDIDTNILFQDERIKTCYVDQMNPATFDQLSETFGNIRYDLIIDDGLHSICANLNTLLFALDRINENGWIVIEDIHIKGNWRAIDFILRSNKKFKTYYVSANAGGLYLVHKL
jgi:hypothetical protein